MVPAPGPALFMSTADECRHGRTILRTRGVCLRCAVRLSSLGIGGSQSAFAHTFKNVQDVLSRGYRHRSRWRGRLDCLRQTRPNQDGSYAERSQWRESRPERRRMRLTASRHSATAASLSDVGWRYRIGAAEGGRDRHAPVRSPSLRSVSKPNLAVTAVSAGSSRPSRGGAFFGAR